MGPETGSLCLSTLSLVLPGVCSTTLRYLVSLESFNSPLTGTKHPSYLRQQKVSLVFINHHGCIIFTTYLTYTAHALKLAIHKDLTLVPAAPAIEYGEAWF